MYNASIRSLTKYMSNDSNTLYLEDVAEEYEQAHNDGNTKRCFELLEEMEERGFSEEAEKLHEEFAERSLEQQISRHYGDE